MLLFDPLLQGFDCLTQLAPRWDAQRTANTGLVFFRPTFRSKILVQIVVDTLAIAMHVEDQLWFDQALRHSYLRSLA